MLDFLAQPRPASTRSERKGGQLSKSTVYQYLNHIEHLYGFCPTTAPSRPRAVGDDRAGWGSGSSTRRFYRHGEKPARRAPSPDEDEVIDGRGR